MGRKLIINLAAFSLGVLLVAALGVSCSRYVFYRPAPLLPQQVIGAIELVAASDPATDPPLHPLTGLPFPENASTTRPFVVMIDNTPEARPQYGLSRADIVYHTLVEGGITRFTAIFSSQRAERIGPVRSARPYFVRQAQDWHAFLVHSGGSTVALSLLQRNPHNISDLDEFSHGAFFLARGWHTPPQSLYLHRQSAQRRHHARVSSSIYRASRVEFHG